MKKRKLTIEQAREIRARFQAGTRAEWLAGEYGVHRSTIYSALHWAGEPTARISRELREVRKRRREAGNEKYRQVDALLLSRPRIRYGDFKMIAKQTGFKPGDINNRASTLRARGILTAPGYRLWTEEENQEVERFVAECLQPLARRMKRSPQSIISRILVLQPWSMEEGPSDAGQ